MQIDSGWAKREFTEELAVIYEQMGLPRMAGRILGWLLICVPSHQSAAELAEALDASKGSISTMTRLLVQFGCVERTGISGKRGDYFRIQPGVHGKMMRDRVKLLDALARTADKGLDLLREDAPEDRRRLEEFRHLNAIFSREIALLMDRCDAAQPGLDLQSDQSRHQVASVTEVRSITA